MLLSAVALLAIGMVMVTSASISEAVRLSGNPFYFSARHAFYILIASFVAVVTLMIPMVWWQRINGYLLCFAIVLLLLVLLIGKR